MKHWEHYWQTAQSLNSFVDKHSDGYKDEIDNFWKATFNALNVKQRVLDIATGNGALAFAVQQYSDQHDLSLTVCASDAAAINPVIHFSNKTELLFTLKKISFFPLARTETLPFSAGSFDLLMSQFGFEYSDQELAFNEVNRVLISGGRFVALVHHADSFISVDSDNSLQLLHYVLDQKHLVAEAIKALEYAEKQMALGVQLKADLVFQQMNSALILAFQDFRQHCIAQQNEAWYNAFAEEFVPALLELRSGCACKMKNFEYSLQSHQQRLIEQNRCRWSVSEVNQIISLVCPSLWLEVDIKPFYTAEGLYSWQLSMVKR